MKKILLGLFVLLNTTILFAQTNVDGNISTSQTWTLQGSPYNIGTTYLADSIVIFIEAGVIVNLGHLYLGKGTKLIADNVTFASTGVVEGIQNIGGHVQFTNCKFNQVNINFEKCEDQTISNCGFYKSVDPEFSPRMSIADCKGITIEKCYGEGLAIVANVVEKITLQENEFFFDYYKQNFILNLYTINEVIIKNNYLYKSYFLIKDAPKCNIITNDIYENGELRIDIFNSSEISIEQNNFGSGSLQFTNSDVKEIINNQFNSVIPITVSGTYIQPKILGNSFAENSKIHLTGIQIKEDLYISEIFQGLPYLISELHIQNRATVSFKENITIELEKYHIYVEDNSKLFLKNNTLIGKRYYYTSGDLSTSIISDSGQIYIENCDLQNVHINLSNFVKSKISDCTLANYSEILVTNAIDVEILENNFDNCKIVLDNSNIQIVRNTFNNTNSIVFKNNFSKPAFLDNNFPENSSIYLTNIRLNENFELNPYHNLDYLIHYILVNAGITLDISANTRLEFTHNNYINILEDGTVNIEGSTLTSNYSDAQNGFKNSGKLNVVNSTFENVNITNSANGYVKVANSNFILEKYSTVINNLGENLVIAENNYWNGDKGPQHATNQEGNGCKVSDNVDFVPFLTEPINETENNEYVFFDGLLLEEFEHSEFFAYETESIDDITVKMILNETEGSSKISILLDATKENNPEWETLFGSGQLFLALPKEIKVLHNKKNLTLINDGLETNYNDSECSTGIISSIYDILFSIFTTFYPEGEILEVMADLLKIKHAYSNCHTNIDPLINTKFKDPNKYNFLIQPYKVSPEQLDVFAGNEKLLFEIPLLSSYQETLELIKSKGFDLFLTQKFGKVMYLPAGVLYREGYFLKKYKLNDEFSPSITDIRSFQIGDEIFIEWKNPTIYDKIVLLVNDAFYTVLNGTSEQCKLQNFDDGEYKIELLGLINNRYTSKQKIIITKDKMFDGNILSNLILPDDQFITFDYDDWGNSIWNYENYFSNVYNFAFKLNYITNTQTELVFEVKVSNDNERMKNGSFMLSLPNEVDVMENDKIVEITDGNGTKRFVFDNCLHEWWDLLFEKIPGISIITSIFKLGSEIENCNENNILENTLFNDLIERKTIIMPWGDTYQFPNLTKVTFRIPLRHDIKEISSILSEHKIALYYDMYSLSSNPNVGGHETILVKDNLSLQPILNSIAIDSKIISNNGLYEFNAAPTAISLNVKGIEGEGEISITRMATIPNDFAEVIGNNPLPQTWDVNIDPNILSITTDLLFGIDELGEENFEENSTLIKLYKKAESDTEFTYFSDAKYIDNETVGDMSDDYLLVEGITSFSKFILAGEGILTDISKNDIDLNLPTTFSLSQNYPNPFNPTTTIIYSVPTKSNITLKIYDVLGKEVSTLVNEEKIIGNYKVNFNATSFSSGIYFYRLKASGFVETKKMILLK